MSHGLSPPGALNPNDLLSQPEGHHALSVVGSLLLGGDNGAVPVHPQSGIDLTGVGPVGEGEDGPVPKGGGGNLIADDFSGVGAEDAAEGGVGAVVFGEGGEDLGRGDGAEADAGAGDGLEGGLEAGVEGRERGRGRAVGPGSPGGGAGMRGVVVGNGFGEVDVGREMRAFVPFREETVEEEGGFADAAGAVEDERQVDAVMIGVVAEHCF